MAALARMAVASATVIVEALPARAYAAIVGRPGYYHQRLLPRLSICLRTASLAPSPTATITINAATPRIRRAWSARNAFVPADGLHRCGENHARSPKTRSGPRLGRMACSHSGGVEADTFARLGGAPNSSVARASETISPSRMVMTRSA